MNTYVKKMREALGAFYEKAVDHENNVNKANQRYKADVAAKDKVIESAKRWGVLDGDKIKDGDMKLLKFDLSPEQFEAIVDRNKNNGTMCFILKQYAEKHAKHEMKDDEIPAWNSLASVEVPTVDEKIKAYNALAERAIGIIQNISGYGWGRGVNGFGVESSVKGFGEPNPMNYKLLEVLEG